MDMEFSRMEKAVGAFIFGVVILLITTLIIIGRGKDWFEKYVTYYTTFNETYNLQENAAVKLFKADIGKVKKITLVSNRVRVKVAILSQYASRIRQDAAAVVESPTLIGSEYISIIPGSMVSALIPEEGEIPSREKRSLNDLMAEFEVEKTAKMVVKAIQDLSLVSATLSDPNGPLMTSLNNIHKIAGHLEAVTGNLKSGKGTMGALLQSEALLNTILAEIDKLGEILTTLNAAVGKTPPAMDLVQDNLANFRDAGASAKEVLAEVKKSTAKLEEILDYWRTGSKNVPRISNTFRDGIEEIRSGVEQIDRVVDSLQQNVFIRSNLPEKKKLGESDADARPR
jgi:phospholipid/cholesterol/gamma-HCH transport system substrate-binding protein